MNFDDVRELAARAMATRDDEPDPAAVDQTLAAYVDAIVAGRDSVDTAAWLEPFLLQSPETADVLDTLIELARMEAEDRLPEIDALEADLRSAAKPSSSMPNRTLPAPAPVQTPAPGPAPEPIGVFPWPVIRGAFPVAMTVGAAAAIALSLTGWARADRRADEATAELQSLRSALSYLETPSLAVGAFDGNPDGAALPAYEALASTVGRATEVRFARMASGAWGRVAYSPEGRRALVWAGGLPRPGLGDRFECWLSGKDGDLREPRTLDALAGDPAWWFIEADEDLGAYSELALMMEPQESPVVRVALNE